MVLHLRRRVPEHLEIAVTDFLVGGRCHWCLPAADFNDFGQIDGGMLVSWNGT
jgi:hypothetical protein